MRRFFAFACLAVACTASAQWPQTRAERTGYAETSHYSDVIAFLGSLQAAGAPVRVTMIGKSTEGRDLPLAIAAIPPVSSPAEARRLGRPIVYVQANIHAGEVEGKEAILHLLRQLSQDGAKGILGKIVLLVVPIYNIDGNERFGPIERNRPGQDGPAMVGVRPNGQGFDLNRDAIKNESPENQALLKNVYRTWDPDVMMDLHTTNGTRHGYSLTYSPPLNPNTHPDIMRLSRDVLVPHLRKTVKFPAFDYGNAERRNDKLAWYTFGQEGRYCTNYAGLRNRIAVLSEAMTYLPFKQRVLDTEEFVLATLNWVAGNDKRILDATRTADAQVTAWGSDPKKAPAFGVRFDFSSRGEEDVLLEKRPAEGDPRPMGRPRDIESVRMQVFDRFKTVKTARLPYAYIIPASQENAVRLLQSHGVVVERLTAAWSGPAETFTIEKFTQPERAFQGKRLITLDGHFQPASANALAGAYLVKTAQPLGILAFHLLEPESLDGVAAWGLLGERFEAGSEYPIIKATAPVNTPATWVPGD